MQNADYIKNCGREQFLKAYFSMAEACGFKNKKILIPIDNMINKLFSLKKRSLKSNFFNMFMM